MRVLRAVFDAEVHYVDIDFAAVRVGPAEVMLHADHTHEDHPWHGDLVAGARAASARRSGCSASIRTRRSGGRALQAATIVPCRR